MSGAFYYARDTAACVLAGCTFRGRSQIAPTTSSDFLRAVGTGVPCPSRFPTMNLRRAPAFPLRGRWILAKPKDG